LLEEVANREVDTETDDLVPIPGGDPSQPVAGLRTFKGSSLRARLPVPVANEPSAGVSDRQLHGELAQIDQEELPGRRVNPLDLDPCGFSEFVEVISRAEALRTDEIEGFAIDPRSVDRQSDSPGDILSQDDRQSVGARAPDLADEVPGPHTDPPVLRGIA